MRARTIVVLGGALAGPTAAARARELDERARIVLLERNRDISYAVGGLAYHLAGEVPRLDDLNRQRADFFRDVYRIEARTGVEVSSIDARKRVINAGGESLAYDSLVYALGASSILPKVDGLSGGRNVSCFRTLVDLEGIVAALQAGARRAVVLGGNFFGVEAADALLRRGCEVTIVEKGPRILRAYGDAVAGVGRDALLRKGARLVCDAIVSSAMRDGETVRSLRLRSGEEVACDLVIVCAGLEPRTQLLAKAGAKIAADGTVVVDERCRTSLPHVYACGVSVSTVDAISGKRVWFAQAAQADKTAQVAGENAAGGKARLPAALGTAIVRVCDVVLARTGVTGLDAKAKGKGKAAVTTVQAPAVDPYMASAPLTVELTYDARTGVLLGGEVSGAAGVDKRIDVLATAVAGKLTVERLASLDLAYAPPFSAARDPLNVAAAVAVAERNGRASSVAPQALAKRASKVTVVDVRDDGELEQGSVPGARHVPLPRLRVKLATLPKGKLVFVDQSGRRGYLAARIAAQSGRKDAAFLAGGLSCWAATGNPLSPLARDEEPS